MMNSRTGYELELNHSHQSQIRQQFGRQHFVSLAKSANPSSKQPDWPVSKGTHQYSTKSRQAVARWLISIAILTGLVLAVVQLTGSARASNLESAALQNTAYSTNRNVLDNTKMNTSLNQLQNQTNSYGQLPLGSYITRIGIKDIPGQLRQEYPPSRQYVGQWELKLQEEGRYSASVKDQVIFSGEFMFSQSSPQQVTFTSGIASPFCQAEGETSATYNWFFDGKFLALAVVTEQCYERGLALVTHSLAQPEPENAVKPEYRRGVPRFS